MIVTNTFNTDIIAIKGHRFKADMKRYKQQETR